MALASVMKISLFLIVNYAMLRHAQLFPHATLTIQVASTLMVASWGTRIIASFRSIQGLVTRLNVEIQLGRIQHLKNQWYRLWTVQLWLHHTKKAIQQLRRLCLGQWMSQLMYWRIVGWLWVQVLVEHVWRMRQLQYWMLASVRGACIIPRLLHKVLKQRFPKQGTRNSKFKT